jgi:hypothetical protein
MAPALLTDRKEVHQDGVKCPDPHEVAEVSEHVVVLVVASAVVELKEEYWWKKPLTALGVPAEGKVERMFGPPE